MRKTPALALVSGTLLLAAAVACSQPGTPSSPSPVTQSADLGPGGATLKAPAPTLQSPANGSQVTVTSNVPLTSGNVAGTNATFPITLEYEVKNAAGTILVTARVPQASGSTTTYTLATSLVTSAVYSWRVRATYSNAFGPWSSTFTFRAPDIPPPYMRGNEIFDPLTDSMTVGVVSGPVQWIPGVGVKLLHNTSHISYELPVNLQEGQYSMMVTGVDESNPGDKAKIMSMQEGFGGITDNDYRMTAELRGRYYPTPGAVQARIITGDAGEHGRIFDTPRIVADFNDESWYFWRVSWRTGTFTLEVRRDGPTGSTVYLQTIGTGSNPYRPVPHVIHIGQPVGRAGEIDATAAGMIVKNLWVSSNSTRPQFPFADIFLNPAGR